MHRRRAGTAAVATTAIAAIGVLSVAPAASASPPAQWSATVCTSLTDWSQALTRLSKGVDPTDRAKPKAAKAALVTFLGRAVDATDTLIDDIKSAGTPSVDHGAAVAKVFVRGISRARELFADAEGDARNLPTGDAAKFRARGKAIERALETGGNEVQGVFDAAQARYAVPALDRAFSETPACKGLGS